MIITEVAELKFECVSNVPFNMVLSKIQYNKKIKCQKSDSLNAQISKMLVKIRGANLQLLTNKVKESAKPQTKHILQ